MRRTAHVPNFERAANALSEDSYIEAAKPMCDVLVINTLDSLPVTGTLIALIPCKHLSETVLRRADCCPFHSVITEEHT